MAEQFKISSFSAHLNDSFVLRLSTGADLVLELIEVTPVGNAGEAENEPDVRQSFSLVFCGGPRGQWLPQQVYALEHRELGTLSVFLVPIGPNEKGMCYEAVFN